MSLGPVNLHSKGWQLRQLLHPFDFCIPQVFEPLRAPWQQHSQKLADWKIHMQWLLWCFAITILAKFDAVCLEQSQPLSLLVLQNKPCVLLSTTRMRLQTGKGIATGVATEQSKYTISLINMCTKYADHTRWPQLSRQVVYRVYWDSRFHGHK